MRLAVIRTVRMRRKLVLFSTLALLSGVTVLLRAATCAISAQGPSNDRLIQHPEPIKTWPSNAKRWALVIGVDQYDDANIGRPLVGASNDAKALAKALTEAAGFPSDHVIVLATDQNPSRRPTRINILTYLSNIGKLVPRDGLLLISFAGHGIDRDGHAYLVPSDARLTDDISLLEQTAVNVNFVRDRIRASGIGQVLILLDACRGDPEGRSQIANRLTTSYTRAFDFELNNRGVEAFASLYATKIGARAYEDLDKRQGYFTSALVEALSGAAANDHGQVTLGSLVRYVQDVVPRRTALDLGVEKKQFPFAHIEGYRADELIIAVPKRHAIAKADVRPNPSPPCPVIQGVTWETLAVDDRGVIHFPPAIRFTVGILNTSSELHYEWTTSAGRVSDGQGTRSALVETNGLEGKQIKATVTVSGSLCGNASVTSPSIPIDESGHVDTKENRVTEKSGSDGQFEISYWESIKTSSNPEDYKDYLRRYPNGRFAELARRRVASAIVTYINRKDAFTGDLAKNFVAFSFEYPSSWQRDPTVGRTESPNFVKVEKTTADGGTTVENFAVGHFRGPRDQMPQMVAQLCEQFSMTNPNFRKLTEGVTDVGPYGGFEFRFTSHRPWGNTKFYLWGRCLLLYDASRTRGVVVVMLASSVSKDVHSIWDVGERGDLASILKSFRF